MIPFGRGFALCGVVCVVLSLSAFSCTGIQQNTRFKATEKNQPKRTGSQWARANKHPSPPRVNRLGRQADHSTVSPARDWFQVSGIVRKYTDASRPLFDPESAAAPAEQSAPSHLAVLKTSVRDWFNVSEIIEKYSKENPLRILREEKEPVETSVKPTDEGADDSKAPRFSCHPRDYKFYQRYSRILGVRLNGTEEKSLIMAISQWLGVPYRFGGCTKAGVDCSCFVKAVYKTAYDIRLRRTSVNIYHSLLPVGDEDLRFGDILSFKIRGNRISHVGIYLKDHKFVHASRTHGVTVSDLRKSYYKKRFYAAGRVLDRIAMSK